MRLPPLAKQLFCRKDRFPTTFVDALFQTRQAVFLCADCERRMGRGWAKQREYVPLDRFRGQGACEYCEEVCVGTLYLPEEGGYAQESKRMERDLKTSRVAVG
jgi:hypothetical protein